MPMQAVLLLTLRCYSYDLSVPIVTLRNSSWHCTNSYVKFYIIIPYIVNGHLMKRPVYKAFPT
jgi:hypothetical protein